MLKTLLAGTALATLLAFAAQAQETPEAHDRAGPPRSTETMPRGTGQTSRSPRATSDVAPESAEDTTAPQLGRSR